MILALSASVVDDIATFIQTFITLYIILIVVQILFSFVRLPYNVWLSRFRGFLDETVNPYLGLFRRLLPSFGPLDLSPMIGILALYVLGAVADNVVRSFGP
jgi:uncharacterized protein YggT (Ycf19 family)